MSDRPSIADLLDRLNEADESHEVEAKLSENELGKSALETVSAFANTPGMGGGYLVCGVVEQDRRFVPRGVQDAKRIEDTLISACNESFNRSIRPHVWNERIGDVTLVAAFIPEAALAEKPVFIKNRGMDKGTFRRVGSADIRCTDDDLRILFRAGDGTAYEDSLVHDATEEDLSVEAIAAYRRQLIDENPGTELRDASGIELVQAVGGIHKDAGRLVPTVAGILLFGSRLALRRLFPQLRVDYVRVPGTRWVPDAERRYDAIEIRDPLLFAFRRAYQAVMDDLPRAFTLVAGQPERRDRPALPEKVVREALVNAITHRDFRAPSATLIIRYSDRIEIRNPGRALVSEEQFGQPGSFPRNPHIADVFREMRLAENKGTGIAAMRRAMKGMQLEPPIFESDARNDRFVTTLWLHSLLDEDELAWLSTFGIDLTTAQRQALVVARRTGQVTNGSLRDLTGLDPLQARRELQLLRDAGVLAMRGERGGAYYVLASETGSALGALTGTTDRGEVGLNRGELPSDRGELPSNRGELPPDRGELAGLPTDVKELVLGLGRKPRIPELRRVLLRVLEVRAYGPSELAGMFGLAEPRKLVERHLSPMITEGLIERTHPENLTHPDQAYRARQAAISQAKKDPNDAR